MVPSVAYSASNKAGCTSECMPPTMGVLRYNQMKVVDEGFGINDKFYDVELSKQTLPTHTATVGEPIRITTKVWENSGHQFLEHVQLSFLVGKTVIQGGAVISEGASSITWNKNFEGKVQLSDDDPNEAILDYEVNHHLMETITVIEWDVILKKPMNEKTIKVTMWDQKKNKWDNYFNEALTIKSQTEKVMEQAPEIEEEDSQEIPGWIRNNARWWSDGTIKDNEFLSGIEYLINEGIINVPTTQKSNQVNAFLPNWVKDTAGWWGEGKVSDQDFINSLQYLIENGIITLK